MNSFVKIITIVVVISFLAACSPASPVAPVAPAAPPAPTAAPVLTAQQKWLQANGLGTSASDKQDWAAIEAAAKVEGSVVVYSNSSRIQDAAKVFTTKYPDIKIVPNDMGGPEVITKVREEQKAGAFAGDVWLSAGGPDIVGEFIPKQYLWKFIPSDLLSVIPADGQDPILTQSTEVFGWIYNSELNKTCPITNWWEITDAKWKGKIFIKDPVVSAEDLGMLMSAANHAPELAAAYKAFYGKDIVLDSDTPDAGWLWIKRFVKNQPIGVAGSDDVWKGMATPGMKDNMFGWAPLSKYRNVTDKKAAFEPCVGLSPVIGVQKRNYLAIINQAPHPNAAKVFIKFVMTAEGFAPWNQVGQFSPRTDIKPIDAAVAFAKLPVWNFENKFVYDNINKYHDFYALNLLK
jgi:iron(III) transport system substrate-binding protein